MAGTSSSTRRLDFAIWPALGGLLSLCYFLAFALRLGANVELWWADYQRTLPFIVAFKLLAMAAFGLHRSVWRYAGVRDLIRTVAAAGVGSSLVLLAALLFGLPEYAIAIAFIDLLLSIVLLSGGRMSLRLLREVLLPTAGGRRLIVVGAGDAGEMVVRELQRHRHGDYAPVAFVDDDDSSHGLVIHGLKVEGSVGEVDRVAKEQHADAILVAICNASKSQLRQILEKARATGLPVKRIPPLAEMISGHAGIDQLRDYTMDDLLPRRTITTEREQQRRHFEGKRVLVTGAAGSIGSELCRQLLVFGPDELLMLDKDENALFRLEHELRQREGGSRYTPVLASVRDEEKMRAVFTHHRPQIVFHAAAYKHVPVLEHFPEEAARNNVDGTRRVARLADRFGCDSFVLISTDKAVRPTSVMGASKRVAELIVADHDDRSSTRFTTIRFGNVLGSNGSVVQLFGEQIARGGPVTVTHKDMKRYFMTIPEAVDLVLFAATMGDGGTYILDMGEQVKVLDMAHHLIRLSGLTPGTDIPIVFTGLRPGEKMYEELWTDEELPSSTFHPSILTAPKPRVDRRVLHDELGRLIERAEAVDRRAVITCIRNLVPEYTGDPVGLGEWPLGRLAVAEASAGMDEDKIRSLPVGG